MNRLRPCLKTLANVKSINFEDCRYIHRWISRTQMELTHKKKKKLPPQPEPKRSSFIDWNRSAEIYAFNCRLSEKFDTEKLNEAFVHKSYAVEEMKQQEKMGIKDPAVNIQDNEKFIKKGRQITLDAIKKYLNKCLPRLPEEGVIAISDYLMSEEMLAKASQHIGTKDIILTGEHPVARETMASTFTALVGALAESVNADHAAVFVQDFLIAGLAEKDLTEIWTPAKPFEMLNDIISSERKTSIEARLIGQAGKNTILSAYHIGIYANKEYLGSGFGQTIAEAKDVAAINIMAEMFGLLHSSKPLRFDEKINLST
ncbi:39S ribosomal protein L44, mitochondrial [Ceratina calcarata]|uniref:Large ribosomal subunit protein mL44 n=1 Tax=Ceratina calcarata TaxID=156304 RepID=A0AAJ7J5V4_9HYME|nr:39S ribosomal protein L44, mitochondrial [Ceratina calcarata]